MTTSLLTDLIILAALLGAVAYGVVLSRRIAKLQRALIELAPALQAFCDAVEQSEQSVEEMRYEADRLEREAKRREAAAARLAPEPAARTTKKVAERADMVRRFFEAARARTN